MINSQKSFNLHEYLDIFLKRKWYFIIPLFLVFSTTLLYLVVAPRSYRSSTLILVSPQKIPEDYVKATVTTSVDDRLQAIAQEIMSRTRLELIISEFKLYPDLVKSGPMETVVESMRKDIKIDVPRYGGEKNSFTISYIGNNPKIVTAVTSKLASLFIEENLKIREQQAQGTTEFLESELNSKKEKLERAEQEITNFKRQYMNELPQNRDANLTVMAQLNLQSQKINEGIKSAEDRKIIIQNQLASITLQSFDSGRDAVSSTSTARPPTFMQLSQLKNQLEELQARYTDNHPDILVTKKKIAELEKRLTEAQPVNDGNEKDKKYKGRDPVADQYNAIQTERKTQLALLDKEITRLKREDEKVRSMIGGYQARIENTPTRELALSTLSRDFNNLNDNYQVLVKKRAEAQQAENLERRQKGEQFRIVDPARIPETPFKPNIPRVLLIGLVLGIGSGLGLTFAREQMDRSFRDAEDLEVTLGLRVLVNIPRAEKKAA
jgi:polysaccharide chain length determinant protein (PEP-CTERM system associated)